MNTSTQIEADSQKNLDRLEREIDQQRSKISHLIDALGEEFSVKQLLERTIGTSKGNGKEFAKNLGHSVQAHPVPALITSVGLLWLYVSRNESPTSESAASSNDSEGGALADVKSKLSDGSDKASEKMHAVSSRVSDGLSKAGDTMREQGQRASDKFSQMLEENPLVLGAAGVALGALLGALLPSTDKEDELLGETSDSVTDKIKQTAKSAAEQASGALDPPSSADKSSE